MTTATTTVTPTRSDRAEWLRKAAKSRYAVPALIGLAAVTLVAGSVARSLTAGPSTEELLQSAAVGARQGAAALVPDTTIPAGPEYFDYLGPLLAYPLTEEARSIITFRPGTGDLDMVNSQAVARQVLALGPADQCAVTVGIEERHAANGTTYRARIVYPPQLDGSPKAGKVPLVVCSTGAATNGTIPTVTAATGGAG